VEQLELIAIESVNKHRFALKNSLLTGSYTTGTTFGSRTTCQYQFNEGSNENWSIDIAQCMRQ
jgi:hypothetical protein